MQKLTLDESKIEIKTDMKSLNKKSKNLYTPYLFIISLGIFPQEI